MDIPCQDNTHKIEIFYRDWQITDKSKQTCLSKNENETVAFAVSEPNKTKKTDYFSSQVTFFGTETLDTSNNCIATIVCTSFSFPFFFDLVQISWICFVFALFAKMEETKDSNQRCDTTYGEDNVIVCTCESLPFDSIIFISISSNKISMDSMNDIELSNANRKLNSLNINELDEVDLNVIFLDSDSLTESMDASWIGITFLLFIWLSSCCLWCFAPQKDDIPLIAKHAVIPSLSIVICLC